MFYDSRHYRSVDVLISKNSNEMIVEDTYSVL